MSYKHWQETINDYDKLFETGEGYDVIIYAGQDENVKEIRAHTIILCTRSQYFHSALLNEWTKKEDGKLIFKKPDISPSLFKLVIRYIYCGEIDLTKLQGPDILKLLLIVDELKIQKLITCIQEYLIKNQYFFLQQDLIRILETIYQHEPLTELWNFCLEMICSEPELLFDSDKFINLKAPVLIIILKRDDLNLDEIIIWDSLIKWSLARNPTIPQDFTKWNKEEFNIVERAISGYIPLIRFYNITPEDFLDKVYPLKKLLPKDLVKNIFAFHMTPNRVSIVDILPPRRSKIDSVLVKHQHFVLFDNWIDKKDGLSDNSRNHHDFKLLYRASRDGMDVIIFHNKCDDKGATIFVAKINGTNYIVGGYNPLDWNSPGKGVYKTTSDSFIFFFDDYRDVKAGKLGRVLNGKEQSAIVCNNNYGPIFGHYKYDIVSYNNGQWNSNPNTYPNLNIPNTFKVDDYEVFQVV